MDKDREMISTSVKLFWVFPVAFFGVFFFYPLANFFTHVDVVSIWQAVGVIFSDPYYLKIIRFTIWQAFLSTVLTEA